MSRKTVKKYVKSDPDELGAAQDNKKLYESIAQLTEKEKRYIYKSKQENLLYNDTEEGWFYHITDEQMRLLGSGLWFVGVVYPESAPPNWKTRLTSKGLQWACSVLHDMDTWDHDSPEGDGLKDGKPYHYKQGELYKAGDRKKLHWHIIVKVDERTPLRVINEMIRPITHGPYMQVCKSLKGAYDYLSHIGQDPLKKYPYYKDGLQPEKYNGFVVEANSSEKKIIQSIIIKEIREKHIDDYDDLLGLYENDPEFLNVILSKNGAFSSAIRSQWMHKHPGENTSGQLKELNKIIKTIKEN